MFRISTPLWGLPVIMETFRSGALFFACCRVSDRPVGSLHSAVAIFDRPAFMRQAHNGQAKSKTMKATAA